MAPQDPFGTDPSTAPDHGTDEPHHESPTGDTPVGSEPAVHDDAAAGSESSAGSDIAADSENTQGQVATAVQLDPEPHEHGQLSGFSVDYAAAVPGGTIVTPASPDSSPLSAAPARTGVPAVAPGAVNPTGMNPSAVNPTGVTPNTATPNTATASEGWFPTAIAPSPVTKPTAGAAEPARGRRQKEDGPETASALTADRLLSVPKRAPVEGWRRLLYTVTFGYVNVGDSDAVRIRRALEHRIAARLGERTRYVPVLSRKGGVGKTTVTTLLGMTLAQMREDRVIALDANPDRGTLSDRSPGKADFTARQLVQNRFMVDSFAQLSSYVAREGSRLHVLASDTDPAVAQAFDDADYRAVTDILSRYYSIVLTDSGTGMVHSVMKGTLEKADTVVLVSGGSVDEARLASETLSWLEAHGRHDLVARAIVVINLSSGNGTQVNVEEIEDHFRSRVSTVVRIPYDRHLAEGSRVDLAQLKPATRDAVVELAALVVDELQ